MTELNKKGLAISLVVVLAVFIGVAAFAYFQNQQTGTYTIIGTLQYAPGHAVVPGISAESVTPSVSPEPNNITFTEANGINYTVTSFVKLDFSDKFTFSSTDPTGIDYPAGFEQKDVVKVSGEMSYQFIPFAGYSYVMNVTSITHYNP
jgi:hypothetical protein